VERVTFRPLTEADLPTVARWLAAPHVREWWREPSSVEAVRAKYLPRIRGDVPTRVFIAGHGDEAIGLIQSYRIADHPEWADSLRSTVLELPDAVGIDYLVGDPCLVGRGIGFAMVEAFTDLVFATYPDVDRIVVTPQAANRSSCRVLEKAGYELRWTGALPSDHPSDAGDAALYVKTADNRGRAASRRP